MRTLVTGGGGFAGSYLVKELSGQGHQVTSVGNGPAPAEQTDYYLQLDLMDEAAVNKLKFKDFDVVFHLAGLANPGESFAKAAQYFTVNSQIQINLFEACLSQQASPRFIIISSAHVYSPQAKPPLSEDVPLKPTSPYAASKLAQEMLAEYYQGRGFKTIVARAFNHIGPGQAAGFLVSDVAQRIAQAEKSQQAEISIGNLEAQRDFTDVRDIVRAYVALAESGQPGGIYNVCSGQPLSGQAIVDQLLSLANVPIKTAPDPKLMRPSDIPVMYGDNSKLKHDTGWEPKIKLEQTLKDTLDYWRGQVA